MIVQQSSCRIPQKPCDVDVSRFGPTLIDRTTTSLPVQPSVEDRIPGVWQRVCPLIPVYCPSDTFLISMASLIQCWNLFSVVMTMTPSGPWCDSLFCSDVKWLILDLLVLLFLLWMFPFHVPFVQNVLFFPTCPRFYVSLQCMFLLHVRHWISYIMSQFLLVSILSLGCTSTWCRLVCWFGGFSSSYTFSYSLDVGKRDHAYVSFFFGLSPLSFLVILCFSL